MNEKDCDKKFKELEDAAEECESLDELFCLWQKAHMAEENPEKTFPQSPDGKKPPKDAFRGSFCLDGITSAKGHEKGIDYELKPHVDVLFVLKESNTGGKPEKKGKFWFDGNPEQSERIDYCKKFVKILKILDANENCRFGYMNLNKRGGYRRTHLPSLKRYVKKYAKFIKKQIQLHSPKIVVFCGCYDVAVSNVLDMDKWKGKSDTANIDGEEMTLHYVYHPSYSSFKKSLDNLCK